MGFLAFFRSVESPWSAAPAPPADPQVELADAISKGHNLAARQAIRAGADPNLPDEQGLRPIDVAIYAGNATVVRVLIVAGATVQHRTPDGETPLTTALALTRNNERMREIATILIAEGDADVRAPSASGDTPIIIATEAGLPTTAAALLKAGADPSARNARGRNAFDVATLLDRKPINAQLEEAYPLDQSPEAAERRQALYERYLKHATLRDIDSVIRRELRNGYSSMTEMQSGDTLPRLAAHFRAQKCLRALVEADPQGLHRSAWADVARIAKAQGLVREASAIETASLRMKFEGLRARPTAAAPPPTGSADPRSAQVIVPG